MYIMVNEKYSICNAASVPSMIDQYLTLDFFSWFLSALYNNLFRLSTHKQDVTWPTQIIRENIYYEKWKPGNSGRLEQIVFDFPIWANCQIYFYHLWLVLSWRSYWLHGIFLEIQGPLYMTITNTCHLTN